MKKIILKELIIRNFKGVFSRTFQFDGSANIFGANETGKSTTYTAFNWLLTGKDEFDRADYEIKNTYKKELNSQAHEVEAIIDTDEDGLVFEHKLKRVYLEKWTKPKGQSQKIFDGHTTDYYFNDVPCNAKEYAAKVEEIIPLNILKLITNPYYFNSMKWEDQRRGLLAIAGTITDQQIIDAIKTPDNDFATLIKVLNTGKKLEEWKDQLGAKKLLLKKAAVEYVPRIDEAKRNKPEADNWKAIDKEKAEKMRLIEGIDEVLSNASKALAERQKGILSLQKNVHAKETELANIKQKIRTNYLAKQSTGDNKIQLTENEIADVEKSISQLTKTIADNASNKEVYQQSIAVKSEQVSKLRAAWDKINAEKFEFDESKCECPTCKQALPADQIEEKKAELLKNFNESVLYRKQSKVNESNQVKSEIKQLQENISAIDSDLISQRMEELRIKMAGLKATLNMLKDADKNKPLIDTDAAIEALVMHNADALNVTDEISELNLEINSKTILLDVDDNEAKKEEKKQLQDEVKELEKKLALKVMIENTDKRIAQLEIEEQENAQAIADIENQEFEIETFNRAKMDILEKRVNEKFRHVTFRLFKKLVNGGTENTCVCEYKGVPYPTLNTAAKLFTGLDILETLSNFYGIHAPVFCDCRESVTRIPDSQSQIISLFVNPGDKELRVEAA